jgi:hypothetical protein
MSAPNQKGSSEDCALTDSIKAVSREKTIARFIHLKVLVIMGANIRFFCDTFILFS